MKRVFVILSIFLFIVISFFPASITDAGLTNKSKLKGICLHGEDIAKSGAEPIMKELKNEGFNAIFLLIKDPQGYVYYKSKDFPVKYPILSSTINAAKKYGIGVYVYFPVFMDKHYGTTHPDQCMVDVSGKKNTYYISLLSDKYTAYLKKFIGELLNYNIRGIVFDYIRFPNGKYDFSKSFQSLAEAEGINFNYVKEKAYETFVNPADWKTLFLLANSDENVKKWIELREKVVENETQILTEYVRNINPNLKIGLFSVARGCEFTVKNTNNIKETYEYQVVNFGQAPDKSFPFVDFISPMVYLNSLKEPPEYTTYVIKKFRKANKERKIYTAINPYGITGKETNLQILYALSYGDGIILFRYPLFHTGKIVFKNFPKPNSAVDVKIINKNGAIEKTIYMKNSPFYPSYKDIVFINGFLDYAQVKIKIGERYGEKTLLPLYSNNKFTMDTAPFIKDIRTFVPIRFVAENLGANVFWNGEKREVTIETNNITIKMHIGSTEFFSNNNKFTMDTAPFIKDNRTFVPIRFVAENLGANVFWNGEKREVTIEKFVIIN